MIRNRPSKRGLHLETYGISSSSNLDGWTSGDELPECFHPTYYDVDNFKTKRKHRSSPCMRFVQRVVQRHCHSVTAAQCVAILLFVATIVNFLLARFHEDLISTQMPSRSLQRVVQKGYDISPLSSGFDVILHGDRKTPQSDFVELERFGRHRKKSMKTRSYGEIELKFLENKKDRMRRREIYHDYDADRGYDDISPVMDDNDDHHDYYYSFDDDIKRNPLNAWNEKTQDKKLCRRTNWYRELPINCNILHEYDVAQTVLEGNTHYLARGAYRQVFLTKLSNESQVVFKSYFFGAKFKYDDYEFMRMDALITEKLSSQPTIVNNYAFCALSMVGEALLNGDMEKVAVPKKGRIQQEPDRRLPLYVWNNLSGEEKLRFGLQMTETVALLHGYPKGLIIHNDLQLSQFLVDENNNLKLNDFNRGEVIFWNDKDNEYCKYKNNPGHGDWRSPEEYMDNPLDDKIDIWSMCNNLYALLTGLYPLYLISDVSEFQKRIVSGETGFIDPRYHNRSIAESKLADIIPKCWAYDPDKRIDIFQLVTLLREAYNETRNANMLSV